MTSSQQARFIRFRSSPWGFPRISRPRRSLRIGGDPRRSCADDSDVWARCLLLLPRLMEIGRVTLVSRNNPTIATAL